LKLVTTTTLIDAAGFSKSAFWRRVDGDIRAAIASIRWPPRAKQFTIFAQSGKKRGEGNGVKPIKDAFVHTLLLAGWKKETRFPGAADHESTGRPGAFDASLTITRGTPPFVVEWETGNISSSHRSLNRMALGLMTKRISGGVLVVPTRELYVFLTDRVGNYRELEPYFPLWGSLKVESGYLGVFAVEHDATSTKVPRISKGTDGRARA
jgi:hypothetical protein